MVNTLIDDVKTSIDLTKVEKLVQEDVHVSKAENHVSFTWNCNGLVQFILTHPIARHGVLNRRMRENDHELSELMYVHTINRFLAATEPTSETRFVKKWSKQLVVKVPVKRQDLFASMAHWWEASPAIEELSRATNKLEKLLANLVLRSKSSPHHSYYKILSRKVETQYIKSSMICPE